MTLSTTGIIALAFRRSVDSLTIALFVLVIATSANSAQDSALNEAAELHQQMRQAFAAGKYAEALPLAEKQVTLWERLRGPTSSEVYSNLLWQGQIEGNLALYARAEETYQRALKIQTGTYGPNHPQLMSSLSGLASIAHDQGKYAESEERYRSIIAIEERSPNRNEHNFAVNLDNLGVVCFALGKLDEAEAIHRRAAPLFERAVGAAHPDYATALANLAQVLQSRAKYSEAAALFQRALEIKQRAYPENHPEFAPTLSSLARAYAAMQKFPEAERFERRSLAVREQNYPANHPEIGKSYNNLAVLAFNAERFADAEKLFRQALAISEKSLPGEHPLIATNLENLANGLQAQGKHEEAQKLYERALAISTKALGPEHPDIATCLANWSTTLTGTGQWRAAADMIDRERRLSRNHIARVLANLDARQQLFYLAVVDSNQQMTALSLGLRERAAADVVRLSAGWLLNGKGLGQESLARNAALLRSDAAPEAVAGAKQLIEIRRQLAGLALSGGEVAERTQKLERLQAQERVLAESFAARTDRNRKRDHWVETDAVRRALPPDGVLIDVARFYEFDFAAPKRSEMWKPRRYAAWITPPQGKGEIQCVDLGPAEPIDEAVQAARNKLTESAATIREFGEAESEMALRKELDRVAKLILAPLLPLIGDKSQWVLSPDASLWLMPWAALPLADGGYVAERYEVRYVVSGRDLMPDAPTTKPTTNAPLIFADPDFDLAPAAAAGETRRLLQHNLTALSLRAPISSLGGIKWSPLPGSAAEAEAVRPNLEKFAGQEPVVHTRSAALEGVLKAAKRPRALLLSTHGFFLSDQQAAAALSPVASGAASNETLVAVTTEGKTVENPLLRCGLALAGANHKGNFLDLDDGVLTGLEIVSLDLHGTEFVALSACETGLGDIKYGDSVAGLRQAFQLAGAQSVLATLWQIPDQESALIINDLFQNLADGKRKAEALCEAQRKRIRIRREKQGAAHPLFWAAWTVTGQ